MRFRTVRPRVETRAPEAVSVGSICVTATLKPLEELPAGVHLEAALEELGSVVAAAVGEWYWTRGHELLVSVPIVT